MCPWQTNTSRVSQSSTKTLFLLDVTLGIESVHFNVSWKVNVRARSELSHFARSACLMWSSVKWSAPRHASFPQQGQSWHFLSLVRAHVSSSRSAPCPASQRRTHREKNTTSLNDETEITLHAQTHLPPPRSISLTLPSRPPTVPARLFQTKLLSSVPPLILFPSLFHCFFFVSLPLLSSSSSSSRLLFAFPVSVGSRRTEWRAFEARRIHRRRINRWEIYCVSECSINSLCLSHQSLALSLRLPPSLSITLQVPCWFPSKAYAPAVSGLSFVPVALFLVIPFPRKPRLQTVISRIWRVEPTSNFLCLFQHIQRYSYRCWKTLAVWVCFDRLLNSGERINYKPTSSL